MLLLARLGNSRDKEGKANGQFTVSLKLPGGDLEACRYDPMTCRPVWHTDGTYRQRPPSGSVLYAVQVPPEGGDTCFADASRAFNSLPRDVQQRLQSLEVLSSQAHHDALHNSKKPGKGSNMQQLLPI